MTKKKISNLHWGQANAPSKAELEWIKMFGRYPNFDPANGKISDRLTLDVANLKQATRIVVYYHYLHRGRTMAQLPYWILVDKQPVGVILYSLPRVSVPLFDIKPMNILEMARLWLHPDVQHKTVTDSKGKTHSLSVASCAVGKSLNVVQKDWYRKYPNLPDIHAIVSWADDVHHEGTIYRACNFEEKGKSGGSLHGNRKRSDGGRDQLNPDYSHIKTMFMHTYKRGISTSEKQTLELKKRHGVVQLKLLPAF